MLIFWQGWIIQLCSEYPEKMRGQLNPDQDKPRLSQVILSKMDETSLAKVYRYVDRHIDYTDSFSAANCVWTINGHASPWRWVCQVTTALGRMLRDLALIEVPMNKSVSFHKRKMKHGREVKYNKDYNFRTKIDDMFKSLGADNQFAGLEISNFAWKPVEEKQPTSKKFRQQKDKQKRSADESLRDEYLMPIPKDLMSAMMGAGASTSEAGPSVPKSPRSASGNLPGSFPSAAPGSSHLLGLRNPLVRAHMNLLGPRDTLARAHRSLCGPKGTLVRAVAISLVAVRAISSVVQALAATSLAAALADIPAARSATLLAATRVAPNSQSFGWLVRRVCLHGQHHAVCLS